MDGDGLDAHFVARAVDPERDLAAVGDQQLFDRHQPMITSGWSNSTGWASATMIFLTTPPPGAVIGFITFIASMISRVSPALTASPTLMNGSAPGSGDRGLDRLAGNDLLGRGGRRCLTRCRSGRWRRGSPLRGSRRGAAADPDAALAVRDLDLGQAVGGQQLGELLDQLRIDPHRTVAAIGLGAVAGLCSFGHWKSPSKRRRRHLRLAVDLPISFLSMSIETQQTLAIPVTVSVNGEQRRVSPGLSITAMLAELGLDPQRVAVERNRDVVPRSQLGEVTVEDGDQYEIVHFVGGG
jgi:thiazole synthase